LKAAETFGIRLLTGLILVWPIPERFGQEQGRYGSSNGQKDEDAHDDEETSKA